MKKLTTKQLAIALLAIAFAFIIGLTTYRGVTGQFKSTPAVTVQTKKTKKKKTASVKKEEKKETTQASSDQATSQETKDTNKQETNKTDVSTKDTKQTTPSQTDTSNKQTTTPSQTETKKNTNTTTTPPKQTQTPSTSTPVKQTVSVRVIGINETMMSGDIEVNSSSTAYSVLRTLAKQNNKPVTTKGFGSTVYVSGIDGLKEFDHGPSSGWMYKVNGTPPNIGSGAYSVKAGDTIIWYYVNVEK